MIVFLVVLLDGSIVAEEGSPELLHGGNIWFTMCDKSVMLKEGSRFEICLPGFKEKRLVFDTVNGNFKVTMFPEQLTTEYHLMKVEAIVCKYDIDKDGHSFLHLIIRPLTNNMNINNKYMLSIQKTKRFQNLRDPWSSKTQEVGRVTMVKRPQNWDDLEHVKLDLMFK